MSFEKRLMTDKTKKMHFGLGAVALTLSLCAQSALALEVTSKISKVDESGKVELVLSAHSKVAIGDKVRIDVSLPGLEPAPIKTRWTVKAINGQTIMASPDGTPTKQPEVGFNAVINTVVEQPDPAPQMTEKVEAAVASQQIEKPVTKPDVESAAQNQGSEQSSIKATLEASSVNDAEMAPNPDASQKTDMEAVEAAKVQEPQSSPEPVALSEPVVPAKTLTENKLAPELRSTISANEPETIRTEKLPTETTQPTKPATSEPAENTEAAAKPEMTDTTTTLSGTPEHECDRLAAHPFDPDAVVKGLDYERLNASRVIAVCQEAIAAFPKEARFYSQLTRGLHKNKQLKEAFEATLTGAELGSAHSMAYLGVMYKMGKPVSEDLKQSLSWFEKAAENGNPGGMVFAAAMFRDGVGTPRDYKKAAELYQQASDLNVAEAMANLGIFLDRGQGVEKNPDSAADYLLKALQGDDKTTQKLFYETPAVLSSATRKAVQKSLAKQRYYRGKVDGDFGPRTREALTRFRSGRR